MFHGKISILAASEGTSKPWCLLPAAPGCSQGPRSPISAQPSLRSLPSLWRCLVTWTAPACPAPSKTKSQTVTFEWYVEIHQYYKEMSCVLSFLLSISFSNTYPFQNLGMCFHLFSGMTCSLAIHGHSTVKYDGRSLGWTAQGNI